MKQRLTLFPAATGVAVNELEPVEILLVEDCDSDAESTIMALKKRGLSNRLEWVKCGSEALDYISCSGRYAERHRRHPKLVLLDTKMPRLNGIEVLRRLKSQDHTRSIPVVMLTSSAEDADIPESRSLGANNYLVKPVGFGAFVDVVTQTGLYWTVRNKAAA